MNIIIILAIAAVICGAFGYVVAAIISRRHGLDWRTGYRVSVN